MTTRPTNPGLFKGISGPKDKMDELKINFERLGQLFEGKACIELVKGPVLLSLAEQCPAQVAFFYLDMNNAVAERGVLEHLVPMMTTGAIVVLDDYGWRHYRAQKLVADELFGAIGVPIVELPTGQGLAIIA